MRFVVAAAGTLPLGFLAAELSRVRAVGGVALVLGLVVCLVLARRAAVPRGGQAVVVVVALAAFAAAHPLGRAIPAPLAVVGAGGLVGATAAAVVPRGRRGAGTRPAAGG